MKKGTEIYSNKNSKYSLTVNIGELVPSGILQGKNILITGGNGGIGYAIAEKCLKQGAKVIIAGRNESSLKQATLNLGLNCKHLLLDVNEVSSFDSVLFEAEKLFGNIDCLVNNAGISLHESNFLNVTEDDWDRQLNTNLKGAYFLTQAWLRYYQQRNLKSGRIVMMASDTSGMGSTLPYGLAKVGISSFTRGLAKHVIKQGIRINAIAPGTTLTKMTNDFTKGEIVRDTTEGNRVLFPEEIAEVCVFLLSDMSACISGQVFGCTEANICFDNTADNVFCEKETNP